MSKAGDNKTKDESKWPGIREIKTNTISKQNQLA